MHTTSQSKTPTITLRLNRHLVPALVDLGSAITLVCPLDLHKTVQPCGSLAVTCIHGNVKEVLEAKVQVGD